MRTYAKDTHDDKKPSSTNHATGKRVDTGVQPAQFVDNRSDCATRNNLQQLADQRPQAQQSAALQKMASDNAKPVQRQTRTPLKNASIPSSHSAPVQRKEVTTLENGKFNMIGESHNDYKNTAFRHYESAEIRKKLGSGNKYYTENQLKTQSDSIDFSDPLDLRVEQIIAFTKDLSAPHLKSLRSINLSRINDTADASLDKPKADLAMQPHLPALQLARGAFETKEDGIVSKLASQPKSVLKLMTTDKYWEDFEVGNQQIYDTNAYISMNAMRLQLKIDQYLTSAKPDKSALEENKAAEMHTTLFLFYDELNGRIPSTFKQYYELKSRMAYSTDGKFNFSLDDVPIVLDNWALLGDLLAVHKQTYKDDPTRLKHFIRTAILALETLLDTMRRGATGSEAGKAATVREKRSVKMDEAAQTLYGNNIAWKVGDDHITDIKKLEQAKKIPATKYAYITKANFLKEIPIWDKSAAIGDFDEADESDTRDRMAKADRMLRGHREGAAGDNQRVGETGDYDTGYVRGKQQLTGELKTLETPRGIRQLIIKARQDGNWAKVREICLNKPGGKLAVLRAGLSMDDLEKMDPGWQITFEEEYQKYDPKQFFLWRWSSHIFVRKRFGVD